LKKYRVNKLSVHFSLQAQKATGIGMTVFLPWSGECMVNTAWEIRYLTRSLRWES